MRPEERIEELEVENAALREQLAEELKQFGEALGRIHELEGQLAKIATTAANRRRVMAQDESLGASTSAARSKREGSQGIVGAV
jgi:hypothetical protein